MKVEINLDKVREKFTDANIQRGRYVLANQALSDMNQFVPMRDSNLRTAVAMSTDATELDYLMPYAKAQFYGGTNKARFSNYTTPGTGPRWDLKAESIYMKDWEQAFLKGADLN